MASAVARGKAAVTFLWESSATSCDSRYHRRTARTARREPWGLQYQLWGNIPARDSSPHRYWRGTRPSQAAKWRPFLNSVPLPIAAATAVARFRDNAFDFGNALTGFWVRSHNINFFIKKVSKTTKVIKEIIKFCNHPAHSVAKTVFSIFKDKRNGTTNSWDCCADCYYLIKQQTPGLPDCESDSREVIKYYLPTRSVFLSFVPAHIHVSWYKPDISIWLIGDTMHHIAVTQMLFPDIIAFYSTDFFSLF